MLVLNPGQLLNDLDIKVENIVLAWLQLHLYQALDQELLCPLKLFHVTAPPCQNHGQALLAPYPL